MIRKVADIILMAEGCAECQSIIRFSFLTTSCYRAPGKMIPKGDERRFITWMLHQHTLN